MPAPEDLLKQIQRVRPTITIRKEIDVRGGQKWVYEAHDKKFGDCCLKIIKGGGDTTEIERLARELSILENGEECPNLPKIYYVPKEAMSLGEDTYPWYLEELLIGSSLSDMLGVPRPEDEVLIMIRDIANAIKIIWSLGGIHRDIKPANIFKVKKGYILLDPGIVKLQMLSNITPPAFRPGPGTYGWYSPDQYRFTGDKLDARSDMHALGQVVFKCLTGRHPFNDSELSLSYPESLFAGPSEALRKFGNSLSVDIKELISIMLAPYRHQRFRTIERLMKRVDDILKKRRKR